MTEKDYEIQVLRRKVDELVIKHQLDLAEIAQLRRWIDALEESNRELRKLKGTWTEKIVLDENGKFDFCSRRFYCSACGIWNSYGKTKYCPECGARMEVQDG